MKKILLLALFFLSAPHAHAAISFATSSPENQKATTATSMVGNPIRVSAGDVLFVGFESGAALTSLSCTYNGVAMSQIGSTNNFTGTERIYTFFLKNPTSGSYFSPTCTFSSITSDWAMQSFAYSGACTTSDPTNSANSSGTAASFSTNLTMAKADSWAFVWARNYSGTFTAVSGVTFRQQGASLGFAGGDSNGTTGTGSYNMQASWSPSNPWGNIMVELQSATACAATPFRFWDFFDF